MAKYTLPEPGGANYASQVACIEGDWVITSDWHLPLYSKALTERMLLEAEWMGVHNLLIAGDLMDFSYLSTFLSYPPEVGSDMDLDVAMVRQVMEVLFERFDKVFIMPGNHDRRIQRALQTKISMNTVFRFFVPDWGYPRLYTTEFPHIVLESGGESFRISHPRSFSKIPTKVASELSMIHETSVISAHGHHFGLVIAPNGRSIAADSGGMFDPERIDYLFTGGDTTHGKWASGFLIVREGNVYPYSGKIRL